MKKALKFFAMKCVALHLHPSMKYFTQKNSGAQPIKLFYKRLFVLSSNQNQKPIEKMFAHLAARAVFVSLFFFKNS